jgi:hypothetical protein
MLEVGREARRLGTQGLLQLLTYGVANRSARLAIDLFAVVGDSAIHNEFRFVAISMGSCRTKSPGWKMFPVLDGLHAFLMKIQ